MKICHITTFWPNRYGHTHYTDALITGIRASRPDRHYIAAERPSAAAETEAYRAVPCFRRDGDYVESIVQTVKTFDTDIAVLQYSNDLFGDDNRFPNLLRRLRDIGVKTVVNTHSVYPPGWRTRYRPGRTSKHFDLAMAEHAACVMVHSRRMKRDLVTRGAPADNVVVIPHGSLTRPRVDRAESRAALGVPLDRKLVLFFGFIWLGKGLDFLLDVWRDVAQNVPDVHFYVGGYTRQKVFYTRAYMAYLRARMRWLGIADRTGMWNDYVPDEMVPYMYSAADLVALPYRQDYSSVSGVVHQAAGLHTLMVCSRIAKFDEVEESISPELTIGHKDRRGWARAITRLLTDQAYADAMRGRVVEFAEKTSWNEVGKQHLALYERLLAGHSPSDTSFDVAPNAPENPPQSVDATR